ncbi:hypothetical protein [Paenibacillus sp. 32352]|uniref:phage neck terminator protein n=1 Tax=Paenibacillus sp. 32352 TaxID=1969111 RepID=UPI0009AC6AA7|nr:hypothetical protein [Paenibacillus sp. 32352]
MIPFESIRSSIVRNLSKYLGIKVIELNVAAPMPEYPFLTYDFTDFGSSQGIAAEYRVGDTKQQKEIVTFTVSFLSYAETKAESIQYALRSKDWFHTLGHLLLKESMDVIVVDIGEITNRDVRIGVEWERRQGFEVEFRTTNLIDFPTGSEGTETIDKANIKEMDNIG